MKPKKRQKLCHNCEGEMDLDVIVCPFCAADLRAEKPEERKSAYSTSVFQTNEQTHQSLYPPPYGTGKKIETPMPQVDQDETHSFEESPYGGSEMSRIFTPVVFFTLGVQLFILGVLMLLFSHQGVIVLKWEARFWFWYILASVPCIYFGYKAVSKL